MNSGFIPTAPLTVNWAVTNRCNFKCIHCYSRGDPSEEIGFGLVAECIKRLADAGVMSINFGGGEPLLRKDLTGISEVASKRGLRVSMNSNGFFINREKAFELKRKGFTKVGISIDSHVPRIHDDFRRIRGSHRKAVDALAFLNEAGIRTSISTVICRINHDRVNELIDFAKMQKVEQLNFHNFKCSGLGYSNKGRLDLTSDEWREFYIKALEAKRSTEDIEISLDDPIIAQLGDSKSDSMVKGSVCGKLSLNIKTNGDITPCGFIPVTIGNIIKDDIREIWEKSSELERMRNKKPMGKCTKCGHYEDCLGGCTARAIALTGDMNNPDPHCWHNDS